MDRKIIALMIILIFSVACLSFVSADNSTNNTETVEIENNVTDIKENLTDLSNYIIPVQINGNEIEFSDGFTGFCIDPSKDVITVNDKFTSHGTHNEGIQNSVKLAIIECYKTGKENDIQNMVSQVLNGNKNYDSVESVLNPGESLDDTAVVKINNNTEATFTFELLKPVDDSQSDCLAYKVSLQTVANDDVLGAGNDTAENTTQENSTADNTTQKNDTVKNTTAENSTADNDTGKDANASDAKQVPANNTIIKNNTIINNENNTTNNVNNTTIIVKQNNTKIINKTNELPKNATVQQKIMRVVGNPITILIIVIAVIAVVGIAMKRRQ